MRPSYDALSSVAIDAFSTATGSGPETRAGVFGKAPTESGSYAHISSHFEEGERLPSGTSAGFAFGGGKVSAEMGKGHYKDAAGDKAYGLIAEGQVGKTTKDFGPSAGKEGGFATLEWGGPDAAIGAKVTDKTAQLNAQASLFNVGATVGERGTRTDESLRAGLAPIGPGGALRAHYGDTDNDRIREFGFGADIGPLSFDYKTEDPLYSLARLASFGLASRGATQPGAQPTNWTQRTGKAVSDLWHHYAD